MKKKEQSPSFRLRNTSIRLKTIFSKAENIFLLLAVSFGLLFIILIPPMQSPDEPTHFFKAYQLSTGNIFADQVNENGKIKFGSNIPLTTHEAAINLKNTVAGKPKNEFDTSLYVKYAKTNIDDGPKTFVENPAGNIYSPIVYLPQSIGIFISRIANSSILTTIWLARFFNLACWIILTYIAIRIIPFAKWAMLFVALNPVTISIASSLSADSLTLGLAFLFTSLIFYTINTNSLDRKFFLAISTSGILLALTKPTNFLLIFLVLIIPLKNFGSYRKKIVYSLTIILTTILVAFTWNIGVKEQISSAISVQKPSSGVIPDQQIDYIINNPFSYIYKLANNYIFVIGDSGGDAVINTYMGTFGWLDTYTPLWSQILFIIGFVLALIYQYGRGMYLRLKSKLLIIIVFFSFWLLTVTAFYLNYSPVGSRLIEGVQGRYFISATPMILGLFTGKNIIINDHKNKFKIIFLSILLTVLLVSIYRIIARYY
jgi:uncharacterized membrane protein